jgi:hypothetical protein
MTVEKTPKPKPKTTTSRPKKKSVSMPTAVAAPSITDPVSAAPADRQVKIELEAYLRAERRGFEPGHELEDWLAAERSVGARADL